MHWLITSEKKNKLITSANESYGESRIKTHTHATTTWLKFEFHARCSCAHQTNQNKKEEETKKAVQCTQCRTLVHWTSWKQWQIRLCLHQPLHNACEVNLGNLGWHVHCFRCKMWPLIAPFRDIFFSLFFSLSLCLTHHSLSPPFLLYLSLSRIQFESVQIGCAIIRWIYLFRSSFDVYYSGHNTSYESGIYQASWKKCILFPYIYYWCYWKMATTTMLFFRCSKEN